MKQEVEKEYELLKEFYGVSSSMWDMIHMQFSSSVFCPANRKLLISEYLIWERFVERAKKHNVVYYFGIDTFLEEYKKAVYSCLNLE